MVVLGLETSCDETAAALVEDGRRVLSDVVSTQVDIHRRFGGVVPELASRDHGRKLLPLVRRALEKAGLSPDEVDHVNAHATSTPEGDRAELQALAEGLSQPMIHEEQAALAPPARRTASPTSVSLWPSP